MSEIKDTQQHPKVEIAVKNFGPIAEARYRLASADGICRSKQYGENLFCYVGVCFARYLRGIHFPCKTLPILP